MFKFMSEIVKSCNIQYVFSLVRCLLRQSYYVFSTQIRFSRGVCFFSPDLHSVLSLLISRLSHQLFGADATKHTSGDLVTISTIVRPCSQVRKSTEKNTDLFVEDLFHLHIRWEQCTFYANILYSHPLGVASYFSLVFLGRHFGLKILFNDM